MMTQLITGFTAYLFQTGYCRNSHQMFLSIVRDFLNYHQLPEIHQVRPHHISQYHQYLQQRPNKLHGGGLSESYIHQHMYALKTFFNWLEESGQLKSNPISAMRFPQPRMKSREPLSNGVVEQLFTASKTLREKAVLHLFYSCGLRRSEVEALNTRDIYFKQQLLYVRSGKGAKRRVVPMPIRVSADLENYYRKERIYQLARDDDGAFILNKSGGRMQGNGYLALLKEILKRESLPQHITLHHLRHSIATHLLANGLHIELVRLFLGHSYLETTQIYAKVSNASVLNL
jgi:integrase/recombinase XerD